MLALNDFEQPLLVQLPKRVVLYQRYLDKGTSNWRYRAVASQAEGRDWQDYTPFRSRHPRKVAAAQDALVRFSKTQSSLNLFQIDTHPGPELGSDDTVILSAYADFYRFYQVNLLLVQRAISEPVLAPVRFQSLVPTLNLMLALDLLPLARSYLGKVAKPILSTVASKGFKDDPYTHAAGALRAMGDLFERLGEVARAADALERSARLARSDKRFERAASLWARAGHMDRAEQLRAGLPSPAPQ